MGTVMRNLAVPIFVVLLMHVSTLHVGTSHVIPSHAIPSSSSRFEFERALMGTAARIVLFARDAETAGTLAEGAFARIAELDAKLSDYRDDSELMLLCDKAGGPAVRVSRDLLRVLDAAQRFAARTDGAFDVTIGPASRLWRRARAAGALPDPNELDAARRLVGYRKIEISLEQRTVRLTQKGMQLDLGGIGKGYAADEALAALRDSGAPAALVTLGGDVAIGDPPPGKAGWQIAIAPLGPSGYPGVSSKVLRNAGVSTSGDAEQYLERDGVRHSHVVDPSSAAARTGRSGVTVVASNAMTSDALSTAAGVMGADRGLRLVDDTPGASALFVELTSAGVKELRSVRW